MTLMNAQLNQETPFKKTKISTKKNMMERSVLKLRAIS